MPTPRCTPALLTLTLLSALASPAPGLRAEVRRYSLEVPEGQDAAFEVEFTVEHKGTLSAVVEWTGGRILAFRFEGPGAPPVKARRSGPSPQRMEVTVDDAVISWGKTWRLHVRALPGRGSVRGTIEVGLPDAPEVVAQREIEAAPPPPPPPEPDPWTLPRPIEPDVPAELHRLFETVERLRATIVLDGGGYSPDACSWQADFLRYATGWRDRLIEGENPPASPLRRYLASLASTVQGVEEIRIGADPLLTGPAPSDPLRRRAWSTLRQERLRPLERRLDGLSERLRDGSLPELAGETWPARFVACLTACEREIEERGRSGEEAVEPHSLARAQWDRFLLAGDVLAALKDSFQLLSPDPSAP